MSNYVQSQYRNRKARKNVTWVTKKEWSVYFAVTLIILFLYSISRGW